MIAAHAGGEAAPEGDWRGGGSNVMRNMQGNGEFLGTEADSDGQPRDDDRRVREKDSSENYGCQPVVGSSIRRWRTPEP